MSTQQNAQNKNQQGMPWPDDYIKQSVEAGTVNGNGASIGSDPATDKKDRETDNIKSNITPAVEPEINPPIYDPETTKKKMPVMDEDVKADGQR